MAFTRFTLPKKEPHTHCNGRMRANGIEAYCRVETNNGVRCPAHDTSNVQKRRQEKAKQVAAASKTLEQKTGWLGKDGFWDDKSRYLSLDRQVAMLAALIDELANRKPLSCVTPQEAETIAKLVKLYADLSTTRVETAIKLREALVKHDEKDYDWMQRYMWLLLTEMTALYRFDIMEFQHQEMRGTGGTGSGSTQVLEAQTA